MRSISDKLLITSVILSAALLFYWYAFFESALNIPKYIPFTPISIYGLVVMCTLVFVLIRAEKSFLKQDPDINIARLTLLGTIICIISETIFQIVRCRVDELAFFDFVKGVLIVGLLYGVIISFLIAHQLKTKDTGRLFFFIIVIAVAIKGVMYFINR